jgi:hypothetical protein
MSNSFTIASIVICTLISLLSREMYLWGQIDTADEKIHGLGTKVLCKEDDSNTIQVGGNGFLK